MSIPLSSTRSSSSGNLNDLLDQIVALHSGMTIVLDGSTTGG